MHRRDELRASKHKVQECIGCDVNLKHANLCCACGLVGNDCTSSHQPKSTNTHLTDAFIHIQPQYNDCTHIHTCMHAWLLVLNPALDIEQHVCLTGQHITQRCCTDVLIITQKPLRSLHTHIHIYMQSVVEGKTRA